MRRSGCSMAVHPDAIQARTSRSCKGLQELGWIEGRNVAIEYRWADGDSIGCRRLRGRVGSHASADVIVATGTQACAPAKRATTTIPIVFVSRLRPGRRGFVASLARPGGNVTGFMSSTTEIGGEMAGTAQGDCRAVHTVAVLGNPHCVRIGQISADSEAAGAVASDCELSAATSATPSEIERAFAAFARDRVEG